MIWHLYASISFEKWNWTNSVEKGIGGSETSQVEMARALAAQGHEVHSYAPLPDGSPREWEGTHWHDTSEVDFGKPGVWMLYRCPETLDQFDASRRDQVRWLMFQDWWYPSLTPERIAKLHRAVILCRAHERFLLGRCPELAGLTWITRNGIKGDLIAEVEAAGVPPRNPKRVMYASSPDRGLLAALKIYKRAKEFVPDLEFYATYGYDNLDKMIAQGADPKYQREKDECMALVEETGAKFLGRIPQRQLYREWFQTGMLVYLTDFFETGWITGLEAQAMGAVPIFSPIYAQGENTQHGYGIGGHPKDPASIARFAAQVARLAVNPGLQDKIRTEMMPDVRAKWDWRQFSHLKPGENWVDAAAEDMARLARPSAISVAPALPRVSVVTPSARPAGLPMVWNCLKRQMLRDFEWIISMPADQLDEARRVLPVDEPRIALLADPPLASGDFCAFAKASNALVKAAKSDCIVFATDWVWFHPNVLARWYKAHADNPRLVLSAITHLYRNFADGMPEDCIDIDHRVSWSDEKIEGYHLELHLAMLPRAAVITAGGFTERFDAGFGLADKELGWRMAEGGCEIRIDRGVEARHGAHQAVAGEKAAFDVAAQIFGQLVPEEVRVEG